MVKRYENPNQFTVQSRSIYSIGWETTRSLSKQWLQPYTVCLNTSISDVDISERFLFFVALFTQSPKLFSSTIICCVQVRTNTRACSCKISGCKDATKHLMIQSHVFYLALVADLYVVDRRC